MQTVCVLVASMAIDLHVLALSQFSARATTGLLFQYNFDDYQPTAKLGGPAPAAAQDSVNSNSTLGNFTLYDAEWLSDSIGIRTKANGSNGFGAATTRTGSALTPYFDSSSGTYTFEVWYMNEGDAFNALPRIMIELRNGLTWEFPCEATGFNLIQGAKFRYTSASPWDTLEARHFENGQGCVFGDEEYTHGVKGLAQHAVWTVRIDHYTQYKSVLETWVDGQNSALYQGGASSLPYEWAQHPLYIGPRVSAVPGFSPDFDFWEGRIFMIAMYNRRLSGAEILNNYQAFLSNSAPVTFDFSVSTMEDCGVALVFRFGDGPGDAYWDFDVSQKERWDAEVPAQGVGQYPAYLILDELLLTVHPPARGTLVYKGQPVAGPTTLARGDDTVYFTPPPQTSGQDFTSVAFQVSDGQAESRIASAVIHVNGTVKAPTALPGSAVAPDGTPTLLTIRGSTPFDRAWIDAPPTDAMLYQVLDPHPPGLLGAPIPVGGSVGFFSPEGAHVWFVSFVLDQNVQSEAVSTFSFSLGNGDSIQARSPKQVFSVAIVSYLVVTNSASVMHEDAVALVQLGGTNLRQPGDVRWHLAPLTSVGVIQPLHEDEIDASFNGTVRITPVPHFFGQLNFQYYCKDPIRPSYRSQLVTHTVDVLPVNDRPVALVHTKHKHGKLDIGKNGTLSISVADSDPGDDIIFVTLGCATSRLYLAPGAAPPLYGPEYVAEQRGGSVSVRFQDYRAQANQRLGAVTIAPVAAGADNCSVAVRDRMTRAYMISMNDSLVGVTPWTLHVRSVANTIPNPILFLLLLLFAVLQIL
jgi:hypothetical protein